MTSAWPAAPPACPTPLASVPGAAPAGLTRDGPSSEDKWPGAPVPRRAQGRAPPPTRRPSGDCQPGWGMSAPAYLQPQAPLPPTRSGIYQ